MKIYLVILEDRHTDVMVYPYRNSHEALTEAEKLAHSHNRFGPVMTVEIEGWLYCAQYSTGGACVRVVEAELK